MAMKNVASNMKGECTYVLVRMFDSLFELVIEGLGKTTMGEDVLNKAKDIVTNIWVPQCPKTFFLIYLPNLGLKMPKSTRFVTNFHEICHQVHEIL